MPICRLIRKEFKAFKFRAFLLGCKKWNSAPCTPAMSAQVSTEDLRERKSSFPTMHKMLTTPAFTLSEFLSKNQLPEAKPVEEELEPKHEEKEGKVKGALRVIKR